MKCTIVVELKLFMFLKKHLPKTAAEGKVQLEFEKGATVKDLLSRMGIPVEDDNIIVINGIAYKQNDTTNALELNDGDTIAIFPPIAGGSRLLPDLRR